MISQKYLINRLGIFGSEVDPVIGAINKTNFMTKRQDSENTGLMKPSIF